MIKLLIADDHKIFREGLREIINKTSDIRVIDEAKNGIEVLSKVEENNYDVILLDISMPGRSGLDILKQLRQEKPNIQVLILSMYSEEEFAVRAMKTGAAGYLVKDTASKDLIEAIRKVSIGLKYVTPSLAEKLAIDIDMGNETPLHAKLSNREYEVMCMISSGKKNKEIAEEILVSPKTVSSYKKRILDKMGMKTNAQLTEYAIRNGLIN